MFEVVRLGVLEFMVNLERFRDESYFPFFTPFYYFQASKEHIVHMQRQNSELMKS